MSDANAATLCDAAERIRRGALSPVELTEACLRAVETRDGALGSFVTIRPELALAQAKTLEDELVRSGPRGPLHGVPIALKDIIATRDYPTHVGSVALANWERGRDSGVAARLRAAGAVVLGKTVTTEAAFMEHHPSIPAPRNPWHPEAWTGVSSSGSGVAVAAELCLGAFGTDTGGSIRFPAYCCGLVGLKPTWGRVSRAGVFPLAPSLDHVGPLTRCVADAAALYRATAGTDPDDPTTLRAPVEPADSNDDDPRGLRIGFDERYCSEGLDPRVASALGDAATALRDAGGELVSLALPSTREAVDAFPTLVTAEAALSHANTPETARSDYSPALRAAVEAGAAIPATEYARAHHARLAYRGALASVFERVDLFLAPAWARTTPTLAEYEASSDRELAALIEYTAPQNLAGVPCLSLPGGFDDAGVPYGIQLVGRPCGEAALLRAGAAWERARPGADRRPPGL